MANQPIQTSYNFAIIVNGTSMSDHCTNLQIDLPQAVNESQAAGAVHKQYRPGMGDPSITATFRADDSTGGVNYTLRALVTPLSTGFAITARRINTTASSSNIEYGGQFVISGDVMAMDDAWGAVPQISVKFVPVSAITFASSS